MITIWVRDTLRLLCASISGNKYPSCIMQRLKVKVKVNKVKTSTAATHAYNDDYTHVMHKLHKSDIETTNNYVQTGITIFLRL